MLKREECCLSFVLSVGDVYSYFSHLTHPASKQSANGKDAASDIFSHIDDDLI